MATHEVTDLALVRRDDADLHAVVRAMMQANGARGLINQQRVTVPGSGHLTTLEDPAAVTAALQRWLDRVRRHAGTPAAATEHPTPRTAP